MALEAKQSICIRCGDFQIVDNTGSYNDPDNVTGYGTPNADFGDTTPYTVSITPPKTTDPVFTLDMNSDPPAPDADGHYNYLVTQEQLGYEGQDDIPSGVWSLRVTFGTEVKDLTVLATGDIERRITKCICCSGVENTMLDYVLKGAMRLYKCHKLEEAQKVIDQLYRDTAACCGCQH